MAQSAGNLFALLFKNEYMKSLIIFLFFLVLAFVALSVIKVIINSIARKTKTSFDDVMLQKLEGPISFLIATMGLKFAIIPLNFAPNIDIILNHSINSLLILLASYSLARAAGVLLGEFEKRLRPAEGSQIRTLFPIIERFSSIFFGILGFLFIMLEWDVQIGPFLASLGLLGLAVSFALKDSLSNIFGGISLVLDKNFNVGDVIKLEGGETGEVIDIGMRSTKIRTWDNEVIIMPNSILSNMKITNFAKPDFSTRIAIVVGVSYSSDPIEVKQLIHDTISSLPGVLHTHKVDVKFQKMADYYLEFKAHFWIPDYMSRFDMEDHATTAVWYALKKANVEIPFPTRSLFIEKKHKKRHHGTNP